MGGSGVGQKLSKFVDDVGDVRASGERCALEGTYGFPVPETGHVVDLVRSRVSGVVTVNGSWYPKCSIRFSIYDRCECETVCLLKKRFTFIPSVQRSPLQPLPA